MTALDTAGNVSIVLGALIFATAALGIIRFPDAYTRISAVGTAGGLGIVFVVVGAIVLQPSITDTAKVALIVILQFSTSAVGSIAIARSAYLTRTKLYQAVFDELEREE